MRRSQYIISAMLMSFLFAGLNVRPLAPLANEVESIFLQDCNQSQDPRISCGETITILFHGLMVGRYNEKKARLEVGVTKLKNEDAHHEFALQTWERPENCKQQCPGLLETIPNPATNEVYEFKIIDDFSTGRSLKLYRPQGASFDRKNYDASQHMDKSQDYRYIPDMEADDLHIVKKKRRHNPFKYVFHVLDGLVKSECLTSKMIKKKKKNNPNENWDDYGYVAELVGAHITLSRGQRLVLMKRDGSEVLWTCFYSPRKIVEARVLYLPEHNRFNYLSHSQTNRSRPPSDYKGEACTEYYGTPPPEVPHFQLYYMRAINVGKRDRFELISPPQQPSPQSRRSGYQMATIWPYLCGMVFQGKTDNEIDKDDMP